MFSKHDKFLKHILYKVLQKLFRYGDIPDIFSINRLPIIHFV